MYLLSTKWIFRDDVKSQNDESEEESESLPFKTENNFNFNFNFENRVATEWSEMECQNENCDFYSQLQELKRENMEKLQQVTIHKRKITVMTKFKSKM